MSTKGPDLTRCSTSTQFVPHRPPRHLPPAPQCHRPYTSTRALRSREWLASYTPTAHWTFVLAMYLLADFSDRPLAFATLPGGLYVLVERFIFRSNVTIAGARYVRSKWQECRKILTSSSIWVFLLLAIEAMKTYKSNPNFNVAGYSIPTWTTPLIGNLFIAFLIPNTSFTGHLCGLLFGYLWGLGYIKFLVPNEKILRWVENKLNLLGRLPHYVSVDQKTYGRYGVLPTTNASPRTATSLGQVPNGAPSPGAGYVGSTQRLGS